MEAFNDRAERAAGTDTRAPLPEPLTTAGMGLGYRKMMVDVEDMLECPTLLKGDPFVFRADMMLRLHSWRMEPIGSVPDDDKVLAQLCGYGWNGVAAWREIRERVLEGWVACSDGRLYNGAVCAEARANFERAEANRRRTAAATDAAAARAAERRGRRAAIQAAHEAARERAERLDREFREAGWGGDEPAPAAVPVPAPVAAPAPVPAQAPAAPADRAGPAAHGRKSVTDGIEGNLSLTEEEEPPPTPPRGGEEGLSRPDEGQGRPPKPSRGRARPAALPEAEVRAEFKAFMDAYPSRDDRLESRGHSLKGAMVHFRAARRAGVDAADMVAAAELYRRIEADRGKVGTEYVKDACNWLKERGWEKYRLAPGANVARFPTRQPPPAPPRPTWAPRHRGVAG